MASKYFNYLFKENNKILFILMFIGFIVCPVLMTVSTTSKSEVFYGNFMFYNFVVFILCYLIPFINFYFINRKKSVDTFFSLPISKSKLFIFKVLFTLIEIFGIYLLNMIISFLIILFKGSYINVQYFILAILVNIVLGITLVFVNIFIIVKCNNYIDSLICMIVYSILPPVIIETINVFLNNVTYGINYSLINSNCFSIPAIYFSDFSYALNKVLKVNPYSFINDFDVVTIYVMFLIGILLLGVSYVCFKNRKGEYAEQMTTSKLMYKSFLPIALISLLIIFGNERNDVNVYLFSTVIAILVYIIGVFIYNRNLKLHKYNIIIILFSVIFSNNLYYVFDKNNGFNISKIYPKNYNSLYLSINSYGYKDSFEIIVDSGLDVKKVQKFQDELVDWHYKHKTNIDENYSYGIRVNYILKNNNKSHFYLLNGKKEIINYLNEYFKNQNIKYKIIIYSEKYEEKIITYDELIEIISKN
ncbi:MAG: hypothetical protein MR601_02200 [Erysipelotrichaceae bacterium]|nr:hypothetical protein [Erysipelotrichaceae bacterium]